MRHIAAHEIINTDDDCHQLKCAVNMHFAATPVMTDCNAPQHVKCGVHVAIEPTLVIVMVYCTP